MKLVIGDAYRLACYVKTLPGFDYHNEPRQAVSQHLGAVLADAVLQSGLNYTHVVLPRVKRIERMYPEARTRSGFECVLARDGADAVLAWQHPEKPARLLRLLDHLRMHSIETVEELAAYMVREERRDDLLSIHGIGPKTADYLAALAGVQTIAVDRHVKAFVEDAGVSIKDYAGLRLTVGYAADLLGIPRGALDGSIWAFQTRRTRVVNAL